MGIICLLVGHKYKPISNEKSTAEKNSWLDHGEIFTLGEVEEILQYVIEVKRVIAEIKEGNKRVKERGIIIKIETNSRIPNSRIPIT